MSVLVWITSTNGRGDKLRAVIKKNATGSNVEFHSDSISLNRKLRDIGHGKAILVAMPKDRSDLDQFAKLENLINDMKLILILPDRKHDTITAGHSLFPRFIGYADTDLADVGLVLKKMVRIAQEG